MNMTKEGLLRERTARRMIPASVSSSKAPISGALFSLTIIVIILAVVGAGIGAFWHPDGEANTFTTARGQVVELYGRGIYRFDTPFVVGNNRGSDFTTLAIGVPLLVWALILARKGSFKGRLLLVGILGYFLYIGSSYALGAIAYNELFLVYVTLFSVALFAFILAFTSFDKRVLIASPGIPRRGAAAFMFASAIVTLGIWIQDPLASLLTGNRPKRLDAYTTLFTHAVDMGVIVPTALLSGVLILRRDLFGYLVATSLLVLEAMLLPLITVATIMQMKMGISFSGGEVFGPIAGFSILAILAVWFIAAIARSLSEDPSTAAAQNWTGPDAPATTKSTGG